MPPFLAMSAPLVAASPSSPTNILQISKVKAQLVAAESKTSNFHRVRSVLAQLQLLNLYDGLVAQARTLPLSHCIASSCCTCVILHRPAPRLMQLRRRKWTTTSWVK